MKEGMNTGPTKMEAINPSLVIEVLKFLNELDEVWMSISELSPSDLSLCEDACPTYKLTVVLPILVREHRPKKSRA
jgi:hypothetical protein